MGVYQLWTYIKKHKQEVVTYVDLVKLAKGHPGGLKLIVDFYSWENFIVKNFWASLTQSTQNRNIIFAGGEYGTIDAFIKDFISRLRAVNIELVFFLDGAKGSSYISSKHKFRTWRYQFFQDQQVIKKTAAFLRGKLPFEQVDMQHLIWPCLQEVQIVLTLQECGCVIHLQVSGEADNAIAKHLRDDPTAFAVLSNDTDFCIFENCVLLPFKFFDVNNELGLGLKSLSVLKPDHLKCGIIHTERVMKVLGLPDHKSLIEFAVISGNDFTEPLFIKNKKFRVSYSGRLKELAGMICDDKVAEKCPFFGPLIASHPDLREAVDYSRQFYSLNLNEEEDGETCCDFSLIAADIRRGKLPSIIAAMYQGRYWHRQVLEDPSPGFPCADLAFSPLRAYIYTILLPLDKVSVTELGRTPFEPMQEIIVTKAVDRRIPDISTVKNNSFEKNLQVFELIIQHQEPQCIDPGPSYFKMYGMRLGFICHLVRYFLLMNWQQNLCISQQEFFTIVAWTFARHDRSYKEMNIVPSPRCVTVENWFLLLYRNAYAFLGNILSLSHEFPAPCELFSGGAWVALYTANAVNDPNPQFREPLPKGVEFKDMWAIKTRVQNIVKFNKYVVKSIIRDVFPFNGR
ncbi:hypothetical protein BsWGS_26917 [Bradybaena similaris]